LESESGESLKVAKDSTNDRVAHDHEAKVVVASYHAHGIDCRLQGTGLLHVSSTILLTALRTTELDPNDRTESHLMGMGFAQRLLA